MKNCLINQTVGLGDIIWVQPIVKEYISRGYTVYFPVDDFYFNLVNDYIDTEGLVWCRTYDNFPMKELFGQEKEFQDENNIYLSLEYADCYVRTEPMIAKYFHANVPVNDWRKGFEINRKLYKEQSLIETYNLYGDYVIANNNYHQPPNSNFRNLNINTELPIKTMSYQEDLDNGFTLFDWIGALENAKEVHTVGTSVAYLVDKYCLNNKIFCYERRIEGQDRTYHHEIHLVHRNSNWVYMD